jgi:hypothetical protein
MGSPIGARRGGREKRSYRRIVRVMKGIAFSVAVSPSSRARERAGSQIVCAPITISAAMMMVMTSKTCVMPPVGAGSAGTNIRSSTVTAKPFWPKTPPESRDRLGVVALEPVLQLVAGSLARHRMSPENALATTTFPSRRRRRTRQGRGSGTE